MAEHNLTPEQERDVESHAPYMKVFWSLLVLTVLEYAYARFLPQLSFGSLVAGLMVLAFTKAFLVGWFFMHLKFEGRWVYMMLVPACLLALILVTGLAPDMAYHRNGFFESPAVADR
jgi:cytochrome c oxidase subunit 4